MYQVLYRKYRPQVFDDVVGQPQVTKVLAEQVRSGRISHAYLFTGSRGTGKTTCARIFSKAVCCREPKNGEPCGVCDICLGIDSGSVLDYTEIDAASNRSIEDVRRIREEAWISPGQAKYRIYVLDEVHMLTNEAFNALLKILEEPPEHVIFILATTDVQKLPGTILSRCQRFDFMRIEPQLIAERLKRVASAEGRELTGAGAAMIAGMADGAMRDSLSILDRCMSEPGVIDEKAVASAVGLVGKDALFALADAVCIGDSAEAIRLVNEFHRASCDSERLCSDLLAHFRNYMIVRAVKRPETIIVCTQADMQKYRQRAASVPLEKILFYIDTLSETAEKLKRSANGVVDAETAILRLCRPTLAESETALLARIAILEKRIAELETRPAAQIAASPAGPEQTTVSEVPQPETAAAAENTSDGNGPVSLPFAQEEDNEPTALPFGQNEEGDEPTTLPFAQEEDDEPTTLPFAQEEDDEPIPLPFEQDEDDEPIPPSFEPDEDDEPIPPSFGPDEDDEPIPLPFERDFGDQTPEDSFAPPFPTEEPPLPFSPPADSVSENTRAAAAQSAEEPFAQWQAVCDEATRISGMFYSVLPGSSAVRIGNTLRLTLQNATFGTILKGNKVLLEALQRAVKNVTGSDYNIDIR
ncbi:MAG: DNA polymerase III subunit gamma/tau [Clostridia bacterium]|nr:DNA polymerase III subunit gamma/tau [Clostridia bacterium]